MKVIVAGSRSINTDFAYNHLVSRIEFWIDRDVPVDEIVSGCALGVDMLGERLAEDLGLHVEKFPANWKRFSGRPGSSVTVSWQIMVITLSFFGTDPLLGPLI